MNLFQIDAEILGCIDENTGEIFDEDKFEALQMERNAKIENVLLWMKNLKSDLAELETERKAFQERTLHMHWTVRSSRRQRYLYHTENPKRLRLKKVQ